MKRTINKINNFLLKRFGVPTRNKTLPEPLDMLIATILSQNTNDNNSFKAYRNLRESYPSWPQVAALSDLEIEDKIRVAGLAKQKARAIKTVLDSISKSPDGFCLKFEGEGDNDILEKLTSFNGVGIKTASCVLLFALDRNVCPVDTHVHRTLNRIGLVSTRSPEKTFFEINKSLPEGIAHQFHTNLIRLGREICKAQKPLCAVCPLLKVCKYEYKNFEKTGIPRDNSFMLLDNV